MNIESLHKYINIHRVTPTITEVLFAGQPCINVSEASSEFFWSANPVFAKLTYGANTFQDLPTSSSPSFSTLEEAIADGLLRFEELGVFSTSVDLPTDTYTATAIAEAAQGVIDDCMNEAITRSENIIEAIDIKFELLSNIFEGVDSNKKKKRSVDSTKDKEETEEKDELVEKTLTDAEMTKREEIVLALKKDKKFMSKYGKDSAYAIATAKAKEVA